MTERRISTVPDEHRGKVGQRIEDELLRALAQRNPQTTNAPIVLKCTDENGALIGGLTGATSYGWLLIKTLWVSDGVRGSGLGRDLMAAAETEARRLGCHSVWLDTSNPDAATFYQRLGYDPFGRLENGLDQDPPNHTRWFMKKSL